MTDEYTSFRATLPAPVEELVASIRSPVTQIELLYLLFNGGLNEPVLIDTETAVRMVRSYSWLLDRVGTEGIRLTGAGYLPPADVEAAVTELGLKDELIGTYNREIQTLPVLRLRETAMKLGLLRKYRGMLLATPRGRALRGDPVGLWWHLAEALPPSRAARSETHAGLLLLAAVSAQAPGDPFEFVTRIMAEIGWQIGDGTELSKWHVRELADNSYTVLHRLGALAQEPHSIEPEHPSVEGALFARAALRTWPRSRTVPPEAGAG